MYLLFVCIYECEDLWRLKEVVRFFELELRVFVSFLLWVLGIKSRFCVRIVNVLIC